ncbi:hypothetical protein A5724_16565 [Mycobacterium sp. ACS1612]|uniref:hypothetical protein n=1 Tax=Mycobacterium sp. ACS1612 TaxID=1834117 RepID=UPI0007FD55E8|nr:hypothetical protein [Mycobacterium sp. ACS1612]OBF34974.1 hypothetical protein A5724_16565 [Mycobacterium sp. ACS1612]
MTRTTEHLPAYTADHPPLPDTDSLQKRIPGWGADLNKEDRPSVPKLKFLDTGAWWDFPERQPEKTPRERSVEHRFLTPAFGTAQPLSGVSGIMRRFAYKFSEGRALHWLILLYADRVDAAEHHIRSIATLRPDNPITQTGVKAEWTRNGVKSRVSRKRVDTRHIWLDPLIVGGPWLVAAALITRLLRKWRAGR